MFPFTPGKTSHFTLKVAWKVIFNKFTLFSSVFNNEKSGPTEVLWFGV